MRPVTELAEIRAGSAPCLRARPACAPSPRAALLGHCRAALSGRTCVADLFLLDPALSGQGTRHGLTQIALFAWVPFLAADAGGMLGGYLAPLLQRWLPQP
jgi:hypothetical protein